MTGTLLEFHGQRNWHFWILKKSLCLYVKIDASLSVTFVVQLCILWFILFIIVITALLYFIPNNTRERNLQRTFGVKGNGHCASPGQSVAIMAISIQVFAKKIRKLRGRHGFWGLGEMHSTWIKYIFLIACKHSYVHLQQFYSDKCNSF